MNEIKTIIRTKLEQNIVDTHRMSPYDRKGNYLNEYVDIQILKNQESIMEALSLLLTQ